MLAGEERFGPQYKVPSGLDKFARDEHYEGWKESIYHDIRKTRLTFPDCVKPMARSLLRQTLQPNPVHRMDMSAVMRHKWLETHRRPEPNVVAILPRVEVRPELQIKEIPHQYTVSNRVGKRKHQVCSEHGSAAPPPKRPRVQLDTLPAEIIIIDTTDKFTEQIGSVLRADPRSYRKVKVSVIDNARVARSDIEDGTPKTSVV